MPNERERIVVTGMGVVTSVGHSVNAFDTALRLGVSGASRLGRADSLPVSVGAELKDFSPLDVVMANGADATMQARIRKVLRKAPLPVSAGVCAATEAYIAADLATLESSTVALLVGGSNLNGGYQFENYQTFSRNPEYIDPRYALSFLDTGVLAAVSDALNITGVGFTVGGASASGNVSLIQGFSLLRSRLADACVCVGALTDFSPVEFQAFSAIGALNSDRFQDEPQRASRPFDTRHSGFVYGQGSGCVVLERLESATRRGVRILGELCGASMGLDGSHSTRPDAAGEARAMANALRDANIQPSSIQYVNAHGTASPSGDIAECAALKTVFSGHLCSVLVNSTKSMIGHTLSAAGSIEFIATILQMNGEYCHPTLNLETPIDRELRFVGTQAVDATIEYAMSNSFGFGGINSSVVLRKADARRN